MKFAPTLSALLGLVTLAGVAQQASVEDKYGEYHLKMLNEISDAVTNNREQKEAEYQKMKTERNKQREELDKEKIRLQDQLRNDRQKQFDQIKQANAEQHEQFKGVLQQILNTIASTEDKKLGFKHMKLLNDISENVEGSKRDSLRHFEEIREDDEIHHNKTRSQDQKDHDELRKERDRQFQELKDMKTAQHDDLKAMFQNIMSLLDEPKDCYDLYKGGVVKNGVYAIRPIGYVKNFNVYCDMERDGGGWTVIQRRDDYEEEIPQSFSKNWIDYKEGFGNLKQEFWLGNDRISALTSQKDMILKVDLQDFELNPYQATFNSFKVDSEGTSYRLTVGGFVGKTPEAFTKSNGRTFTTQDRVTSDDKSCAVVRGSGWWFSGDCETTSNLNGVRKDDAVGGIVWEGQKPLIYSQMKIKPVGTQPAQLFL